MITVQQFMTGVVMGTILIAIGLVPSLLDKWAAAVSQMAETLLSLFYGAPVPAREHTGFGQQRWIAALGMAVIALSLYLYTAR
jgi:hypothetical protein